MRRSPLLVALLSTFIAAACGGSAASSSPPAVAASSMASTAPAASASTAPSAAPSLAPSSASSAAPSGGVASAPTAAPTVLNPASLVTQDEASALAGGPVSKCAATTVENRKTCTYSGTGVQVWVTVIQAPSQAALDAGKAAVLADLQKAAANGLKTTRITGIGDDAALLSGSHTTAGIVVKGIGVYAVKGLTFVAMTVIGIGHNVPDAATIEAQATTTIGRVP
jgi:hypothetical protein